MSALKNTINLALLMGILSGTTVQGQTGTVVGTVQATGPDGQVLSIPGVRLMLTCEAQAAAIVVSDQAGQFRFASVPVGSCSLRTDVQGFKAVSAAVHSAAAEQTDVPIFLEVEALYTGLTLQARRSLSGHAPTATGAARVDATVWTTQAWTITSARRVLLRGDQSSSNVRNISRPLRSIWRTTGPCAFTVASICRI